MRKLGAQGHWSIVVAVGFSLSLRFEIFKSYQGGLLSHIALILRMQHVDTMPSQITVDAAEMGLGSQHGST